MGVLPGRLLDHLPHDLHRRRMLLALRLLWLRGVQRDVALDKLPFHRLTQRPPNDRVDPPNRRRRKPAGHQLAIQVLEVAYSEVLDLERPNRRDQLDRNKAAVLAQRGRRPSLELLGVRQPAFERRSDRQYGGGLALHGTLGEVQFEFGQRLAGLSFRPGHRFRDPGVSPIVTSRTADDDLPATVAAVTDR